MGADALARRRNGPGLVMVPPPSGRPHRSDAVQFEVRLNEALGLAGAVSDSGLPSAPDAKRLSCHVAMLRSILASGALGPLQHVMEVIISELLRSSYSDAVTTSPLGEASGTYAGIEGIPFFEQLREAQEEVAQLSRQLAEQQRSVEESINYLKQRTLQEAPSRDEEEMAATIGDLERQLQGLKEERAEALNKVQAVETEKMEALRLMEAEVRRWKQDAQEARKQTKNLKRKAKEQEAVRLAFAELRQPWLAGGDAGVAGWGGSPVGSMAQQLKEENELAEAVAMESQLILLQNARIEEYEAALESTPPSEVSKLREDFVQELQSMQEEMVKLIAHIRSFEERLPASLPMALPQAAAATASPMHGVEPAKQADLEVSFDGGVTFAPLRHPQPVRTLSSRANEFQAAFTLPKDATHVRIRPPGLKSSVHSTPASSPTPKPSNHPRGSPQNENRAPDGAKGLVSSSRSGNDGDTRGAGASAGPSPEDPLWDGYFARVASWGAAAAALAPTAAGKSRIPRTARRIHVDRESLLDTIEAVLRAKLKSEGAADSPGEAGHPGGDEAAESRSAASVTGTRATLHVFFYKWLEEKYGVRATVLLVAHGLLCAVENFRDESAVVRLFGQVLAGKLDDATWRYTMQWRRVASMMTLDSKDEFREFNVTLYPGMKDDELASLVTEYAACTPRPSRSAAIDFLTARLLSRNEPRVKKWTKILKWKDTTHKNGFRRLDFLEIVGKLFPMLSTDKAAAQYDAAARLSGGDRVAVETLALITSCLDASLVSTTGALQAKTHPSLIPVAMPSQPPS